MITQLQAAGMDANEINDLLANLDNLSDEEAQNLLE
jgi:hypothetical protein